MLKGVRNEDMYGAVEILRSNDEDSEIFSDMFGAQVIFCI